TPCARRLPAPTSRRCLTGRRPPPRRPPITPAASRRSCRAAPTPSPPSRTGSSSRPFPSTPWPTDACPGGSCFPAPPRPWRAPAQGYQVPVVSSAPKTPTPLRDVPQAITVVTQELIRDQLMMSISDVVRYVPGVTSHQGENNRDQIIVRGNSSSADFFVNGVRDDVQYYRDLYNVERIEALKGPNGMVFGRGGGGGVINRVTKHAGFLRTGEAMLQAGSYGNRRFSADLNQPLTSALALRVNGVFEDADSFRRGVGLQRYGIAPSITFVAGARTMLTVDYEHFND